MKRGRPQAALSHVGAQTTERQDIMDMATALKWASIVFQALAAGFWGWASIVKTPPKIWVQAHVGYGGTSEDLQALANALQRQSRLNACGAGCAAVAAAIQVFQ